MRKSIKRGGYYTVEAAIFLPIFIIAILTVGYLIKIVGCVETSMHAAVDESRRQAALAYTDRTGIGFEQRIENRMISDNEYLTQANVSGMRYLSPDGKISFDMEYHIDIRLPLDLYDGFDVDDRLKCRGWIGKSYHDPFGFEAMERAEDATIVYIFPSWGSKYHKKTCTHVTANPVQTVMSDAIRKKYKACRHCHPKELSDGSIVYCFPKYGDAYHRGDCNSIKKYTVTIEKSQAESRGYTPCSKCGGS